MEQIVLILREKLKYNGILSEYIRKEWWDEETVREKKYNMWLMINEDIV